VSEARISLISARRLASRLQKIDELTRRDHSFLEDGDHCYYFGEYTARESYAYSATNQLIHNLKKTMDKRGTPQWRYKGAAIAESARLVRSAIKADARVTFVPIPPSKAKDDPLYDDRLVQILRATCEGRPADYRELLIQQRSVAAAHVSEVRPTIDEVAANYQIDEALSAPEPQTVFVLDDVLTTGCHFKAAERVLRARFPRVNIVGIFVARRVPKSVDVDFDVIEE
jgi:predicted amidophosphoribosyltransferase